MMTTKPKNTTLAVFKALVILAVSSQSILPMSTKASVDIYFANSTEKLVNNGINNLFSIEMPALTPQPTVKAKTKPTAKKASSKVVINSPGESQNLTIAEGEKPDKVMSVVFTAYNSVPGQTDSSPFIAATGKRVHDSMIAANKLPFGTRVVARGLFGEKVFIVEDRMNSRYGLGRMDVWMESVPDAREFGVQRAEVEIYYPKKAPKEVAVNRAGR